LPSTVAERTCSSTSPLSDVFVHISALERSGLTALDEGQRVTVDVAEGRKGLEAARIRLS
jgi:cold shock protein